jgi:glutamate carboxypeptidase
LRRIPEAADVGQIDVAGVQHWMSVHRQEILKDLVDLVQRETPSDDVGLLEAAGDCIEQWIHERIGKPEKALWRRSRDYGPVLVTDYPGSADTQLVALGHFDTVFPAGTLASWPAAIDGDRLSGPGVFDMKAGLVQMVWAVKGLDALGIPRPCVRFLFNSDEEIGSRFSRPLIEEACDEASAVLVFEGSAKDGAIKTARKGVGLFTVEAEGVEAHAGLDPESGASAIDEIARVIRSLHDAADLSSGTSINVGIVDGGTRANVLAGKAVANIDVRVAVANEQHRVDRVLASLRAHHPSARIRVSGDWNRPIMTRTDNNIRMYEIASAVARRLGVELGEASVGGASDGNFVAALGIPVLDGLGGVGEGAHARHESVSIAALVERAALASGVIASFAV